MVIKNITIEKTYKSFEEFNENEQNEILNKYRDLFISDFDFESEYIIETFIPNNTILNEIENIKYYYTGFYSQGDGGRFEFNFLTTENLKSMVKLFYNYKSKEYRVLHAVLKRCPLTGVYEVFNNHYTHENTFRINLEIPYNCSKRIENLLNEFEKLINEWFRGVSLELYKKLIEVYEYTQTNEYIIQRFIEDEMLFCQKSYEVYNGGFD